ncbi:MAG: bifunctional ADP-heptose synthase [Patescibacteria group bacterium]|nr:bifunctional ADP-heptose synthase [Patescibacteria group bacterium]
MPEITTRCQKLLKAFPRQTVLGVGDLILDQYRRGTARGLSPEAPVVNLYNPDLTEVPGGTANVAWNIGHLGGRVHMVGVVGKDAAAQTLRRLLESTPGVTLDLVEDPERPTTLKIRFYHAQFQLLRVNHESRLPLDVNISQRCRKAILEQADRCRAIFVEDYGKQLINADMINTLCEIRARHPKLPVIFDPKIGNHDIYRTGMCTLLKPNWKEACALAGRDPEQADRIEIARHISKLYAADILITLGSEGVLVYERGNDAVTLVPTRPREAYDVAGAGDTTLAVVTLSLAAGASLLEAAILANLAGGIVVEKSGTAYVTPQEIQTELQHPKTQSALEELTEAQTRSR